MAVQKITYDDKSFLNQNSNIADVNKCNDTDMNEIKSVINNNATEVENIQNGLNYLSQNFSNSSCAQNTSNNLAGLTLSEGYWIVVGYFNYSQTNLRYYLSITSGDGLEVAHSCYDNAGVVAGNIVAIIKSTESKNVVLKLWPTDKNITVSGYFKAIKYQ